MHGHANESKQTNMRVLQLLASTLRMKIYTVFNLVTLPRMIIFMKLNISEF